MEVQWSILLAVILILMAVQEYFISRLFGIVKGILERELKAKEPPHAKD